MTYYIRNANSFRVTDSMEIHEKIPVGTYIIEQDQFGNFYLNLIDNFEPVGKVYGNCLRNADRILTTFNDRKASTGVMLTGEKGSGKSLLAKTLSIKAREQGISTIVINRPWTGDAFNKLIQDIDQPVVILFDEFEKVYNSDQQEAILTLFDGMFPTKKLFVLTCNDKWRVDRHMRNRPGRIYYMMEFKGLEVSFVEEYCRENLKNQANTEGVIRLAGMFAEFNFDMLKAVVEEMNRYGETAAEVMHMLNAKPEYSEGAEYDLTATLNGVPVEEENLSDTIWRGNPLNSGLTISVFEPEEGSDDEEAGDWNNFSFNSSNLRSADGRIGKFIFQNDRMTLVLTRRKEKKLNLDMLF